MNDLASLPVYFSAEADIARGRLDSYLDSAKLSAKTIEKVLGLIVTTAVFLLGNQLITG